MWKVAGITLNVIGLAITLYGIVRESRDRRAPLLRPREVAALLRIRRALGWRQDAKVGAATATVHMESWVNAIVQSPRVPSDPLETQLSAIEANFDRKLDGLKRQVDRDLELQGRRISKLGDEHSSLAGRVVDSEKEDRAIAASSLRIEVFGVALALLGTSLSALD